MKYQTLDFSVKKRWAFFAPPLTYLRLRTEHDFFVKIRFVKISFSEAKSVELTFFLVCQIQNLPVVNECKKKCFFFDFCDFFMLFWTRELACVFALKSQKSKKK